jgi:hypothetical protein
MPELSFPIPGDRDSHPQWQKYFHWSRQETYWKEFFKTHTDPYRFHAPPADVAADIEHFERLLSYCETHALPFPCIEMDNAEPMPVDWASFLEMAWTRPDMPPAPQQDLVRFPIAYVLDTLRGTREVATNEVAGIFYRRLMAFMGAGGGWRGIPQQDGPSLFDPEFKVNTKTKNLRVHYSRAYLFNPRTVFGGPTSPVTRRVQPGRYVFGVADGAGYRFESAEYDIPPETETTLEF